MILGVLNVVQALFTELDPDEAYYWIYSQDLDWGYFDHPAGVALAIKGGFAIFSSTLGVRLAPILLLLGTVYLLWLILGKPKGKEDIHLFALLVLAMPMLHVYGFISTPDAPLLFFGALYLYLYKIFLDKNTWGIALAMGLCMAAMLHSKYHGVLWIFFILLSNLKLLRNPKFWVAGILGFICFFPHLYWQYSNDFPSFRYHLSGRDDKYEFKYTLNYLGNQLVIFSPLVVPFIWQSIRKWRPKNTFEKSWLFLIWGFWGLFLLLTLKGHAEPHWTALLSLVFVLLLYRSAQEEIINLKWLKRMVWSTIVLLLIARIFLLIPFKNLDSDFHKRTWVAELKEEAHGLPILFMDSYRDPSKYAFYAKERAYTLTDVYYRKNQYDLFDWEKALHNQKVYIVGQGELECAACLPLQLTNRGGKTYAIADSFQVTQNVWIEYALDVDTLIHDENYFFEVTLENPYRHTIQANTGNFPIQLYAVFIAKDESKHWIELVYEEQDWPPGKNKIEVKLKMNRFMKAIGPTQLFIGVRTGDLFPAINSKGEPVFIKSASTH